MQSDLRTDGTVRRRATGINIEHRIKAAFADVAMQVEPFARRIHASRRNHIAQSILGDLHGFLEGNQLIHIIGMKKKAPWQLPPLSPTVHFPKSVCHSFLTLPICSSDNPGTPEQATASSTCVVLENPTSTVETFGFIRPNRIAA